MNNFERVREFFNVMGLETNQPFSQEEILLRWSLVTEEKKEAEDELFLIHDPEEDFFIVRHEDDIDRVKLTKELADLLYVVHGVGVAFGLPLQEAFEEVHRSNMSKLDDNGKPIYNSTGKVMKGPNYKEANITQFFES